MDGFVGGGAGFRIPALGYDDGWLPCGLADDHAGFVGNGDTFKVDVAGEDLDVQGHANEIFGWRGIPAIQTAIHGDGYLAIDSRPGALDGPVVGFPVENLVLAGVIRDQREAIQILGGYQRTRLGCPALKISNLDSERCWITCARTVSADNRFGGALESALLIATSLGDGCLIFIP